MGLMGGNAALDEIDHIAKMGLPYTSEFLGFAGGVIPTKANHHPQDGGFGHPVPSLLKGSYDNLL